VGRCGGDAGAGAGAGAALEPPPRQRPPAAVVRPGTAGRAPPAVWLSFTHDATADRGPRAGAPCAGRRRRQPPQHRLLLLPEVRGAGRRRHRRLGAERASARASDPMRRSDAGEGAAPLALPAGVTLLGWDSPLNLRAGSTPAGAPWSSFTTRSPRRLPPTRCTPAAARCSPSSSTRTTSR
jgi:hypothetical protein